MNTRQLENLAKELGWEFSLSADENLAYFQCGKVMSELIDLKGGVAAALGVLMVFVQKLCLDETWVERLRKSLEEPLEDVDAAEKMRRIEELKARAEAIGCRLIIMWNYWCGTSSDYVFGNIRELCYVRTKRIYKVANALDRKHHRRQNEYVFSKDEIDELERHIEHDEKIFTEHGAD